MLKFDFHLHTNKDPYDKDIIEHTPKQLIDRAKELDFDVLSITHHGEVFEDEVTFKYAKEQGILLISGAEAFIGKKHVLIINISQKELDNIKTFDDIRKLKRARDDVLVIAPHPFYVSYPNHCLQNQLKKNLDVFDGVEFCHFYSWFFNFPNWLAKRFAKKHNLALIGTSDSHRLEQLNYTFSLIDSKKDTKSIIKAIKENKIQIISRPLPLSFFGKILLDVFKSFYRKP